MIRALSLCSAAAQANKREQKVSNICKGHSAEPLHSQANIIFHKLLCQNKYMVLDVKEPSTNRRKKKV